MIFIAHRGNTRGPDSQENHPDWIDGALEAGYNVEADLWVLDTKNGYEFFLGHDNPQYQVAYDWLRERSLKLWIHCKNIEAFDYFSAAPRILLWNFFWHQEDDYTMTSNGHIWAYPGKKLTENTICVMPERANYSQEEIELCRGICSDYVESFK